MENIINNKDFKKTIKKNKAASDLMINVDLPVNSFSQMISKKPNIVNCIDEQGETLLSYAIKQKKKDICQIILKSRILDLNYQDKNGNSYLHLAIIYKLERIAITLIKNGINIDKINNNGNTCLNLAYFNKLDSIIPILKNSKKDLERKYKESKLEQDLTNNKKSELIIQTSRGKTTKENSMSKDRSNNNSNLIEKKANKNIINKKEKLNNNSKIDSKNLKLNLIFDKGVKSDIQKIEGLQSLREMQKTQIFDKYKIKNPKSLYLNKATDVEKKSKYKKFVKENIKNEEKLAEENAINNKINNLEIGNNTSTETKYKSGTNKDKSTKTNNIEDKDKLNDKHVINFKKEDDIFGLDDFRHFEKNLEFEDDLNNDFKKYSFFNTNKTKNFNEDEENMKETYERITKKYVDEVIKNSKSNNEKDSEDIENNSQIKEDDEYCVRYEDTGSSDEEIDDKNRDSLNIFENSLVLNQNNKDNIDKKTRNANIKEQIKLKNDNIRDKFFLDIMGKKHFSKTLVNNKKIEKLSNKSSEDNNNDSRNQIAYQLYPENEYKYTHNLNDLLNEDLKKDERKELLYKINKSQEYKEPILLPEIDQIPKDVEMLEDIDKNNLLKEFLIQISMQKYLKNFIDSGFDDIKIILEQAQKGIYIKDSELKEAGILIPGDRAKILIRIQEKAGNFKFNVPKSVYYVCKKDNKINNDVNIKNLRNWLKNLRIDNYLKNFIYNGYHSIELLFLQMESQSPLTAEILKEEIGIDKVGHRSRIINKLKEDGRSYINNLKTSVLLVGNPNNNKFCDCLIY